MIMFFIVAEGLTEVLEAELKSTTDLHNKLVDLCAPWVLPQYCKLYLFNALHSSPINVRVWFVPKEDYLKHILSYQDRIGEAIHEDCATLKNMGIMADPHMMVPPWDPDGHLTPQDINDLMGMSERLRQNGRPLVIYIDPATQSLSLRKQHAPKEPA